VPALPLLERWFVMGLTNFPNGVSSFGIPMFGGLPATFGDVWFVDYANGSDGNTGKSTTKAFKTLSKAYDACTTNNNDMVLIDGNSEIVETSMITLTKNRVHTIGLNGPPPGLGYGAGARVTLGTTGVAGDIATLHNTGVRNTFTGIKFSNSSATATCLYTVAEGGEYTRYNNCEFYKSGLLTTDLTAEVLCNGDSSQWYGCTFGDLVNERGASGKERPNVLLTRELITGKVARDCAFVDCLFQQKAAHEDVCFFYGPNATDVERRLLIIRPVFWNCVLATADPAHAVNFAAAQTAGDVLVVDAATCNVTHIGGASLNIYIMGAVPTQNTAGLSVEITS
jgi:hypothetical protein